MANGRNLTPDQILLDVCKLHRVGLDPCYDPLCVSSYMPRVTYDILDDGYSKEWETDDLLWLNPPGTSFAGGDYFDRLYWLEELEKPKEKRSWKPEGIYRVTSSNWFNKAWEAYKQKKVKHVLALCFHGGSIGSLPLKMLNAATLLLTCKGVESPLVSTSGRLAFQTVKGSVKTPQNRNMQSSIFVLLTESDKLKADFKTIFSKYGTIK